MICAVCEAFFFRCVHKINLTDDRIVYFSAIDKQLNNSIARNYALLSIFNVALFRSSSAFINNSFSMYTVLFAYTCWFSNVLPVSFTLYYHIDFYSLSLSFSYRYSSLLLVRYVDGFMLLYLGKQNVYVMIEGSLLSLVYQ